MLDDPLAHGPAGPVDDVQHALRDSRFERQLPQLDRGERRELGRLEDDRVPGGEGRPDLPARDREREVPRRDEPDDAERLAEGDVDAARDGDLGAEQPFGRARVVVEDVDDAPHLPPCVGDRLADVSRFELRELLDLALDCARESPKKLGPVARGNVSPAGEGGLRARDCLVRLFDSCARELGENLLGRRLENLHGFSAHGHFGEPITGRA